MRSRIGIAIAIACAAACGSDDGGPSGPALPLTSDVLRGELNCWRENIVQIYDCMESVPDVSVVSGTWDPTGVRCTDDVVPSRSLTFEPPAPNGALSDSGWIHDRVITFWNGDTTCGELEFIGGRILGVTVGGARAESERRSSDAGGPDTRYVRLTCPDGTTYAAHQDEVNAVWNLMPRRSGSVNFQRNEYLTMTPPGDRQTMYCTFPP